MCVKRYRREGVGEVEEVKVGAADVLPRADEHDLVGIIVFVIVTIIIIILIMIIMIIMIIIIIVTLF